jgi:hypothetical protein
LTVGSALPPLQLPLSVQQSVLVDLEATYARGRSGLSRLGLQAEAIPARGACGLKERLRPADHVWELRRRLDRLSGFAQTTSARGREWPSP